MSVGNRYSRRELLNDYVRRELLNDYVRRGPLCPSGTVERLCLSGTVTPVGNRYARWELCEAALCEKRQTAQGRFGEGEVHA